MGCLAVLLIIAALAVAGYLGRDWIEESVERMKDQSEWDQFYPARSAASSDAPQRLSNNTHDNDGGTSWAVREPGPGIGQYLSFTFSQEFRLAHIMITPGASTATKDFAREGRPTRIKLTAYGSDRKVKDDRLLELKQVSGDQEFPVGVDDVAAVRLTIVESEGPKDQRVAIAEVEFFGRQ